MKTIALMFSLAVASAAHAAGPGLQMYSLQEDFDGDTPGTLDRLKTQGFTDIETSVFTKLPAAAFRELLQARGMTCSSHQVRPEDLEKRMGQVIADAKALGAMQVVCQPVAAQGEWIKEHRDRKVPERSAEDVYWEYVEKAGEDAVAETVLHFLDRDTVVQMVLERLNANELDEYLYVNFVEESAIISGDKAGD